METRNLVCAFLLLHLLHTTAALSHQGAVLIHGGRRQLHADHQRHAARADINTNVSIGPPLGALFVNSSSSPSSPSCPFCCQTLRSSLVHRDALQTGWTTKSPSEKFRERLERSHKRINRLQNHLTQRLRVESKAVGFASPVTAIDGEYVMELSLGTPPQKLSGIVDTGSDLTWVQCSPYSVCFQQPHPSFDPAASASYSQKNCNDDMCKVSTANSTLFFSNNVTEPIPKNPIAQSLRMLESQCMLDLESTRKIHCN